MATIPNVAQILAEVRNRSIRADDKVLEYNPEQQRAVSLALNGKSVLITGSAGTGKTTTSKMIVDALIRENKLAPLESEGHKTLADGALSIAFVSLTNKAIQNIKRMLPADLAGNCMTVHKLLEYVPAFYDTFDPNTGQARKTRTFEPSRHAYNPLPNLAVILIDEGTTVEVALWNRLVAAIKNFPQIIIVGDIHQLPPIFGKSIFISALQLGIEKVELTKIYRQAELSPIISLAHRIKSGKQIPLKELETFAKTTPQGKVTIRPWKTKLEKRRALATANHVILELIRNGEHDPYNDIILTPFNKEFGTIGMNAEIATFLARQADAEVFEIYSGIQKKYLRIGDKIIHRGMEGQVTNIERNGLYYGKRPRPASRTLSYLGIESGAGGINAAQPESQFQSDEEIEKMLEHLASHTADADKISREASHKVTIYNSVLDTEITLSSSGDLNALDLGYAITVHKSIGSEWDKVLFVTHHSQAIMQYRELLYTAVTRAAKELYVICEPDTFVKGINSQRVPGNTLEEKIASFNRIAEMESKRNIENKDQELSGSRLLIGIGAGN